VKNGAATWDFGVFTHYQEEAFLKILIRTNSANTRVSKAVKILFVEDDESDAVLVNHELSKAGLQFHLEQVTTRDAFLHKLEHNPPDLILSDHGLPTFDGFEALALAQRKCPEVPFIFVTSSMGEQMTIETFENGATDYVLKGQLSRLVPVVQRALQASAERVQLKKQDRGLRQKGERSRRLLERAQDEAIEVLDEFCYAVSHDLRGPLLQISGQAEALQAETEQPLNEKASEHIRIIAAEVKKLGALVDALFDFPAIGRTTMRPKIVDFGMLVEEARRALSEEIENRKIEWAISPLPKIRGDPRLLKQAVGHLLSNALKSTKGRAQAKIEVGSTAGDREDVFFIRDNGLGFAVEPADKPFRVFQRLEFTQPSEGRGIGLLQVGRIVRRHGGRVRAKTAPGQGTTLYFSIPRGRLKQPSCEAVGIGNESCRLEPPRPAGFTLPLSSMGGDKSNPSRRSA
jgi:signal transduction histidine kinase